MSATANRSTVGHARIDIQCDSADGHLLLTDHRGVETHFIRVGEHPLTVGQPSVDTHLSPADGQPPVPSTTTANATPITEPSGWDELRICADLFARAQAERIAVSNMLPHSDRDLFGPHLAQLKATENAAKLMLRRCYRRVVPAELRQFQQEHRGIGEDSFARILGHLGDPYIATPYWWEGTGAARTLMVGDQYVRTVSQLWSYCGHGDPNRKRTKGMTAEDALAMGSPTLKMLVHLQAEWCMWQPDGNKYRDVYTAERAKAETKVHATLCVRCGPSGKPAPEGSPWGKAHQHAHALRIVGKEILRGMWLARHQAVNPLERAA